MGNNTVFSKNDKTDKIINHLNKLAREGGYVYRGYNNQEKLYPSIIRDKKSYIEDEESMLIDFEQHGSNYFHVTSPMDFMSYAQHFGIPTRLLDFTYNPLIALYYAVYSIKGPNNSNPEDNDFYYIRYASIESNICLPYIMHTGKRDHIERPIESMADKAYKSIINVQETFKNKENIGNLYNYTVNKKQDADQKKMEKEAILFVTPSLCNLRITMQQGLYMFPYTLDREKHKEIIMRNTSCIKIHKKHRKELLKYLDTLGYNTYKLMPDLGSICDAINQKYKDKRMNNSEER